MAFNLENMTVDYKKLLTLVPTQRQQLAQSGAINDIIGALTPGQLVTLFPRYYRERLPDVGQVNKTLQGAMSGSPSYTSGGGSSSYTPWTPSTASSGPSPSPGMKTTITQEQKAVQDLLQEAKVGQFENLPKGKIGLYRPAYNLSEADLSDEVVRTIAGEAYMSSKEGIDAVINVMLNRVGSKEYGSNLFKVASQGYGTKGVQFEGYNKGKPSKEQAEYIRERIRVLASGAEPDNTFGANEFRADWYVYGEGRGKSFYRDAEKQGFVNIGGNIFAARGGYKGPYQGYDKTEIERRVRELEQETGKIQDIETAMATFEPSMIEKLDSRLQEQYKNASPQQQRLFEEALGKLGVERFNERMKQVPINSATLTAVSDKSVIGAIPNAAVDPSAVGGKRRIPLTEAESGIKVLERMNWVSEQTGLATGEKISYEVFSALQPPGRNNRERGGEGTGGYRHGSNVGAADIRLVAEDADGNKRYITANSEGRDREILNTALKYIGKSGFTGVGVGKNYMNGHLHVGFGDPALWNSAEKGDIMRDEYAQYIRAGQQEAADQGFDFEEMKQERLRKEIEKESKAIATADPVSAAQNKMETEAQNVTPTANASTSQTSVPAVAMATGGLKNVPPGENIVGVNTTTGKAEFFANDRENIRVEPATLEEKPKLPTVTQEEVERLEKPLQQMQRETPRPTPPDNSDPYFIPTMSGEMSYVPPSALRATNRARLYGEESSSLVNGHFR